LMQADAAKDIVKHWDGFFNYALRVHEHLTLSRFQNAV
jgi:hypothetical protein